ncbi:hypothetical protein HCN44_010836 [Aphidius gifuensis]|uniref:Diacylglycerol kinase n=1 Tax=Aphidius gifuensis TaxID=684658 RepID=A0A834XTN4_APHGI|nr:diacylglycerol kinase zeta-like [Aphidius gifuensis]KAF7992016.1 hypothetical protein HCN44_010836 [Aphidius gifuensis]
MQRLRSTFKRSRTPTGAEMKSQSSLEVPKQIRSASFDEIQLEAKRQDEQLSSSSSTTTTTTTPSTSKLSEKNRTSTLRVPKSGQRSKSFDIYEKTSLIPSSPSARSSGSSGSRKSDTSSLAQYTGCYHCACVKAYKAQFLNRDNDSDSDLNNDPYIDYDYHDDDDDDDDQDNNDNQEEDDDDDDNNYQSSYGINYHVDNYGHDDDDDDDNDAAYEDIDDDVSLPIDDSIESDEKHEKHEKHEKQPRDSSSPEIRVTLINFDDNKIKKKNITIPNDYYPGGGIDRPRRLSRQEAVISFPLELPSINAPDDDNDDDDDNNNNNNVCNKNGVYNEDDDDEDEDGDDDDGDDDDDDDDEDDGGNNNNKFKLVVGDIFLTVPELKRDRAASVDSCFNNNKNNKSDCSNSLAVPQQNTRSKSVDIVLPTDQQTRYTALLPNKDQRTRGGKEERPAASGDRELRTTPDWGPGSINGEHLWVSTNASGDFCYVTDCSKHGERLKCAACRVSAHKYCLPKLDFDCKAGYRDVGVRQYREQTSTDHHWVHRRSQKGKCTNCSKSFQSKLSFSSKEIVAVICSWCKLAYHNKEACFNVDKVGENCELGLHKSIIVPPSWILKLPRKGSFKSSLRKSPKKIKQSSSASGASGGASGSGSCTTTSKRKKTKKDNINQDNNNDKKSVVAVDYNTVWMIKPIPSLTVHPLLVFINPKSGGNQGAKLLQKFQWFLNPRQVFDLTQGGPRMGLELFKRVPNLRVLACGGDGTVGWVLSIIDLIDISPSPAVGVLPLGTGNDLARSLGWGGGYTDEPITKILTHLDDSGIRLLDRWSLKVTPNPEGKNDDTTGRVKDNLPLNVVNNYFSLGVDAHIALEFHEAREANPEKFNSRMRNKVFYGQMGGKDLIVRRWKDLSDYVTLECDGIDITPKLIEHRVHAIVFLNISSYGGGTRPWAPMPDTKEPSTDDGLIEVIGLTTFQLPLLQAGGHGTPLAQCSRAVLSTKKTIPMQVDGEACRVLPSIIEMNHLNKATMLTKRRSTRKSHQSIDVKLENLTLPLMKIKMSDYEAYNSDKDRLKKTAIRLKTEPLELEATTDLETLRNILSKEFQMDYCCFLDSCTAERFFRIDVAQEHLHYVTDVISEAIYILEEDPNVIAAIKSALDDKNKDEEIINQVILQQQKKLTSDCKITSGDKQTSTSPTNKNQKTPTKDSNNKYNQTKTSPKETASSSKYLSSAERLFSLSGNVNTTTSGLLEKTTDGIVHCAKTGDLKKIKDYHDRGYSLMSIDSNGQTALHIAAKNGHRDIVQYLITCGPPSMINMLDNDKGQTALHKAVQHKNRSICCMLVAAGSTLIVRDKSGKTPRDYANEMGETNLAIYLQNQEEFQMVGGSMQKLP